METISKMAFDVQKIRKDFPTLAEKVNGKSLVYLDNAATSQTPQSVIDRMNQFYTNEYGTVHRGIYFLSQQATDFCDQVRKKVQEFIGAPREEEVIFVRGATEAINLVASSYGRKFFEKGKEIIISEIEHHANIVPWQQIAKEKGLILKVIPVNDAGELILEEYEKLLTDKTVFVSVNHISNALGTVNPVKEIIEKAHAVGAKVLIDGAQSVPHMAVDVEALDADFYCFSGHKMYGPTGIGVLYGKYDILKEMDPYQTGGDMIDLVTFEKTTFLEPPLRFEAGTPAIVETIGLGTAIEYIESVGYENIQKQEEELYNYALQELQKISGFKMYGSSPKKASVITFNIEGFHPQDIGTLLDQEGIAIRVGHHCAQPTMQRFGVTSTARVSLAFYNTKDEIDLLIRGLKKALEILG